MWTLTFQIFFVIQYVIVVINWPVDNFVNKISDYSFPDRLNGKNFGWSYSHHPILWNFTKNDFSATWTYKYTIFEILVADSVFL